jgi:exo-1,4-beta-D-glucosaminidase
VVWLGPSASKGVVVPVGLREASNDRNSDNNAVFVVNGKRVLIRGGGWAPDLLQRMSPQRHSRMLRLAKDLGLNAIRLEGKLQDDDLFEQCDAMGIMILPGICCCDAWQSWPTWSPAIHQVIFESDCKHKHTLFLHYMFFFSHDLW